MENQEALVERALLRLQRLRRVIADNDDHHLRAIARQMVLDGHARMRRRVQMEEAGEEIPNPPVFNTPDSAKSDKTVVRMEIATPKRLF